MRERLIELIAEAVKDQAAQTWEEVADYLLDNGVVVLPCKVGDTVYWVSLDVCRGSGDCNGFCSRCVFAEHKIESIEFAIEDYDRINYDVFLTKEEAEEKLAELNNRDAINTEVNYSDAMNVYRELNTHDREKSVSELAELKGE